MYRWFGNVFKSQIALIKWGGEAKRNNHLYQNTFTYKYLHVVFRRVKNKIWGSPVYPYFMNWTYWFIRPCLKLRKIYFSSFINLKYTVSSVFCCRFKKPFIILEISKHLESNKVYLKWPCSISPFPLFLFVLRMIQNPPVEHGICPLDKHSFLMQLLKSGW